MPAMDTTTDQLDGLNAEQERAVSAEPCNMLVLAGAGSGKTRVLTRRITWLLQHHDVSPHGILAVTFTNKASKEMRERISSLTHANVSSMWVGTFHGLAHRFLRMHWEEAGLPDTFQILDADDQQRLIKRAIRDLNIDEAQWPPKQVQWFINQQKEKGIRADQVSGYNYFTEVMQRAYKAYEVICESSGLVDFTELLLRCLETLQKNDTLREHYQQRFQHILIDEFQDTNTIQYEWIRTLKSPTNCVIAVGDDDQSIYSWRGAQVENIQHFKKDFADVQTVRLEQNYRSTKTILDAANALIDQNTQRLGKNLWTEGDAGDPITLYAAFNEQDEAYYIARQIKKLWLEEGRRAKDVAVLYRSNAQSRVLEEQLIAAQIPYRIYGGLKFFDRAEIKDSLAYLRLIANRNDDAAFDRIVNVPTRGVGNQTVNLLREAARDHTISLWQASEVLLETNALSARAANAIKQFLQLIDQLDDNTQASPLNEIAQKIIEQSGLLAHYNKEKSTQGRSRVENLAELVNATAQYQQTDDLPPLVSFLSHVAIEAGEEQASEDTDYVNLMTLHSAKGLEFPLVFITGLEEHLFPNKMALDSPGGLEEERRLCYVGMTRAMIKLVLTHTKSRRVYGTTKFRSPSRFIDEIPEEFLTHERASASIAPTQYNNYSSSPAPSYKKTSLPSRTPVSDTGFSVGQRVGHKKFGDGIITNFEGNGDKARVQVAFDNAGSKWLSMEYAKLNAL
jgi:DNA helicase-2/ATP-dependent DNA helicase PcrA